jgi:hypothetical protein
MPFANIEAVLAGSREGCGNPISGTPFAEAPLCVAHRIWMTLKEQRHPPDACGAGNKLDGPSVQFFENCGAGGMIVDMWRAQWMIPVAPNLVRARCLQHSTFGRFSCFTPMSQIGICNREDRKTRGIRPTRTGRTVTLPVKVTP